jgi:hypothetical protein
MPTFGNANFITCVKTAIGGSVYEDSSKPDAVVETSVIHQHQGCEANITIIQIKK